MKLTPVNESIVAAFGPSPLGINEFEAEIDFKAEIEFVERPEITLQEFETLKEVVLFTKGLEVPRYVTRYPNGYQGQYLN